MRFVDLVFSAVVLFLYGMAVVCLGLVVGCGFAAYAAWDAGLKIDSQDVVGWVVLGLALLGAIGFARAASWVDRAWDKDRQGAGRGFEVKEVALGGSERPVEVGIPSDAREVKDTQPG